MHIHPVSAGHRQRSGALTVRRAPRGAALLRALDIADGPRPPALAHAAAVDTIAVLAAAAHGRQAGIDLTLGGAAGARVGRVALLSVAAVHDAV